MTCREFVEFLMSYLDNELDGESRRVFEEHLGRCSGCIAYLDNYRMTVKMGRSACHEAFAQLEAAGMIESTHDAYQQTALGDSYFEAAEQPSNERLYRPWSVLSRAEYAAYKDALAEADKILEEL